MGKGKPRRSSNGEHYKVIEDDSWFPNDDWKNKDTEEIWENFKRATGYYPEELDAKLPPLKRRTWYDD